MQFTVAEISEVIFIQLYISHIYHSDEDKVIFFG